MRGFRHPDHHPIHPLRTPPPAAPHTVPQTPLPPPPKPTYAPVVNTGTDERRIPMQAGNLELQTSSRPFRLAVSGDWTLAHYAALKRRVGG